MGKYRKYADPDFPKQFAQGIHTRFWEMYLGVELIHMGFNLTPKNSPAGPDIHFMHKGKNYWIEAIAPGEGEGIDAVPHNEEHDGFVPVPDEKIILRFTNAISEKKKQFEEYKLSRIVQSDDILIIAINGGKIDLLIFDESITLIVKSVFPIGNFVMTIDRLGQSILNEGYSRRIVILKESGSPVETSSFLHPDYSMIAGILYNYVKLVEMPSPSNKDVIFIHNPLASSNCNFGWLGVGTEYFVENQNLMARMIE